MEKIIETSQDPSEIVSSLRKVSSKYYESFPNYRTAHPLGFKKDGSVSIGVDTLQMSIPQRLWAGVTHDFGSQPVSFGLELTFKAIAIPFKAMSSLATGKFLIPQRTSPRDQYWIVALKGWKKIQNLLSLDQKLGRDLKVPFRDAAKLSESQEFLLKCRGILSRFTD